MQPERLRDGLLTMVRSFRRISRQGFTFNELLVAMNVIVIGVLGLSIAMVAVIRGNKGNDNFAVAVSLAHDKIEQLKASNHLTDENRCPGAGDNGINSAGSGGGIFDRCWKILPSALGAQLKQVDVTVSWREPEAHQVTLSSLIFTDEPF
jgi:Tfp pilus assembly protein PilV